MTRARRWTTFAAAAGLAALAPAGAGAGGTRTFRIERAADFDAGEAEGVWIQSTGQVRPGFGLRRVDTQVASVWCALEAPDGTVYLGTGDEGRVLAVRDDQAREVARLDAVVVTSLAWADGTLYAGTLPGGTIHAIGSDGATRAHAKLAAEHVWALHWDAAARTLYAATGPDGKLFAVDADGKARELWASGEKHLLALAPAPGGGVYVGSADEAIVYRVSPEGRAFAVHDFAGEEVRALAIDPAGVLYVAANEFEGKGGSAAGAAADKGTRIESPPADKKPPPPSKPTKTKGKGAVYRVHPDGRVEQLHAIGDAYFTALWAEPDGVWTASAGEGKVFVVRGDRTVTTALDLPERQALALSLGPRTPLVGAADAGAIHRVEREPPDAPRYRSRVLDAQFLARWGRLRWRASGALALETRSGNTAKPDPTWSDWSAARTEGARGAESIGRIASPPARYLQIRATWPRDADTVLSAITAYYRPENQPPRVTELTAGDEPKAAPGGGGSGGGGDSAGPPARAPDKPRAPVLRLKWKVENPDGDALVYRLHFREESEATWRPLGGTEPLEKPEFEWNTESIADGLYRVRVTASDERANPAPWAMAHELVSDPLLVDNRKPDVVGLVVQERGAAGRAVDSYSPIANLEYAIDGGPWTPLASADGFFDDLVEAFSLSLPASLTSGAHTLAVRAVDGGGNVGVSQVTFRVP